MILPYRTILTVQWCATSRFLLLCQLSSLTYTSVFLSSSGEIPKFFIQPGHDHPSYSQCISSTHSLHWEHRHHTFGIYVLSLIYSNVAVCGFCAVRWVVIICFPLLLYNYSIYFFCNVLFMLCILVLYVIFLFCLFCVFYCFVFCFSFCILLSLSYFFYKFTDHCHRVEAKLQ